MTHPPTDRVADDVERVALLEELKAFCFCMEGDPPCPPCRARAAIAALPGWQDAVAAEDRMRVCKVHSVLGTIAEQRCERGIPYDTGVMAAYNAVMAMPCSEARCPYHRARTPTPQEPK